MVQDQKEAEKVRVYPGLRVFQQQDDAVLDQDNPDSGVKYTVLDTTRNVKIESIIAVCTWSVQPSPLEIHLTVDGQAIRYSLTDPESTKFYLAVRTAECAPANQLLFAIPATRSADYRAFLKEGRSVKVEAEITGGTVSNLSARMKWSKL